MQRKVSALDILRFVVVIALTAAEARRGAVQVRLPNIRQLSVLWEIGDEIVGSSVSDLQHELLPRESDEDTADSCSPNSAELSRRLSVIRCDADYIRAVQEAKGRECDLFGLRFISIFLFQNQFDDCGTDRNGTLCTLHSPFMRGRRQPDMQDLARDILEECFEELSLDNCSSECRRALEEFSARFDCCIHSTSITTSDDYAVVLAPNLWSSCGVERPEPCADTPRSPESRDGVTCSYLCAVTQYLALDCKYRVSKQVQAYRECGDDENALENEQRCGFNDKGEFCAIINTHTYRNSSFLLSIYNKCYRFFTNNGTCLKECQEALVEFKDLYGCCVNNFNETDPFFDGDIGVLVTRGDLWTACDIESPGFCSFPSDPSLYDKLIECDVCNVTAEGTGVSDSSTSPISLNTA